MHQQMEIFIQSILGDKKVELTKKTKESSMETNITES